MRVLFSALFCALLLASWAAPAMAKDKDPRAELARYNAVVVDLEKRDGDRRLSSEIGVLRGLLGEVQAYLNQEEEDLVKRGLDRIRVQTRLIDALLARDAAEKAARLAHDQADAREVEAAALRNKAHEREQELAGLETEAKAGEK